MNHNFVLKIVTICLVTCCVPNRNVTNGFLSDTLKQKIDHVGSIKKVRFQVVKSSKFKFILK